ncbi:hypothetical protein B9G69_000555 [Bdellovibrio sp. SKB1291214]|uniref:hypothetical protein n=1 Tax=Bdellovibrio sp. SKB1291214 TaxID=1732569 RepID=UPI000B51BEF0|nr:hypothetical protein [Bdellovibrio sp. SKB1291214]UYL09065.1 hypothetical protein B9G69_000555 [Bdellovibrio sp. SKB1291214]
MKFIVSLLLLFSASAFAETQNPFDAFVGSYKVVGAKRINNVRAATCDRYRWKDLESMTVKASDSLFETHQIRFVAGPKESLFQVQEFQHSNDVASTGDFAETSGGEGWAASARGSWRFVNKQHTILTLIKSESGLKILVKDESFGAGNLKTGCYYEADMIRIDSSSLAETPNPFDAFLGSYAIEGKPRVQEVGTNYCLLYNFAGLKSVIIKTANAKDETHRVDFASSYKTASHSVMNYETHNDNDTAGAFAVTSGGEGWAANIRGAWSVGNKQGVRIRLKQTERGVVVSLDDETFRSGKLRKGCYYEADLVKVAE